MFLDSKYDWAIGPPPNGEISRVETITLALSYLHTNRVQSARSRLPLMFIVFDGKKPILKRAADVMCLM